jgi:hypothetical protein
MVNLTGRFSPDGRESAIRTVLSHRVGILMKQAVTIPEHDREEFSGRVGSSGTGANGVHEWKQQKWVCDQIDQARIDRKAC